MKINVTWPDITKGRAGECYKCPVALAISRVVGKEVAVFVYYVIIDGKAYTLPVDVQDIIYRLDAGGKMKPFSFELGDPLS